MASSVLLKNNQSETQGDENSTGTKGQQMITIDQLLESVDLDFEPRWVTKDKDGDVWIWNTRPNKNANWCLKKGTPKPFRGRFISEYLKLSEFENKPWQECIYEVPQKTTGKIEEIEVGYNNSLKAQDWQDIAHTVANKINELVAAVNELKEVKNE